MTNRNQPTTHPLRRTSRLRAPTGLNISRALDEARRRDFLSFVKMSFDLLTPGKSLLMERYIEALAYHLEQVRVGRIRRLIINLPPRYLKSLITSVAFPAYVLGHDPTKRLIVISYGSELAVSLANDFRKVISSPRYKSVFPGLQLSRMKNTEYEIATTRGGFRLATSVDGPLTGRGGDIIIVDDPLKRSDASSESKREHVNEWYRNTLHSMLDDKRNGAIIIVMQRLHDDDLCGFVLKNSRDWVVLNFPAIAREDEQIQIGDGRFHHRRVGDVLHPGLESKSDLDNIRSLIGEHLFAAQYQQCPIQPAGMMIKRDAIKRYDHLPIRTKSHFTIQSWDTAIKTDAHNDYSVCVTLLVDDRGNYYVVDVLRDRLLYPEQKAHAISQAQKHKPDTILIEEAALGRTLVKDLKAAGLPAVGIIPEGDKLTRMSIQSEKFAKGQVFFPTSETWLADFETELLAFPHGRYDDQIDALIQGLAYERPTGMCNDAALKGLERFNTGLWLSQMRGF
jgi:predicted phage terminase large subunit-like protein